MPGAYGRRSLSAISCGLPRSCPDEKCSPAPATITTRTESSSATLKRASSNSSSIMRLCALRTSGRFTVMVSTESVRSSSRFS